MGALQGRVAVVTGATSGIGARTAEVFAREGAQVVVAGRRQAEGEAIAAKLNGTFVRTDITVEADVERLIAHASDRHGRVDVLVSSAGGPVSTRPPVEGGGAKRPGNAVADASFDMFQQSLRVHLGGVLLGMKYAARVMLEQGHGSIVNIASTSGRLAGWSELAYSAAKAAVIHLTRVAAIELASTGIRVNSISPGPILTGYFAKVFGVDPSEADRTAADREPAFAAALRGYQPIPRAGLPDDVAAAALWLASDASSFVTGHDLVVDGGISAGLPTSAASAGRTRLAEVFAGHADRDNHGEVDEDPV